MTQFSRWHYAPAIPWSAARSSWPPASAGSETSSPSLRWTPWASGPDPAGPLASSSALRTDSPRNASFVRRRREVFGRVRRLLGRQQQREAGRHHQLLLLKSVGHDSTMFFDVEPSFIHFFQHVLHSCFSLSFLFAEMKNRNENACSRNNFCIFCKDQ